MLVMRLSSARDRMVLRRRSHWRARDVPSLFTRQTRQSAAARVRPNSLCLAFCTTSVRQFIHLQQVRHFLERCRWSASASAETQSSPGIECTTGLSVALRLSRRTTQIARPGRIGARLRDDAGRLSRLPRTWSRTRSCPHSVGSTGAEGGIQAPLRVPFWPRTGA